MPARACTTASHTAWCSHSIGMHTCNRRRLQVAPRTHSSAIQTTPAGRTRVDQPARSLHHLRACGRAGVRAGRACGCAGGRAYSYVRACAGADMCASAWLWAEAEAEGSAHNRQAEIKRFKHSGHAAVRDEHCDAVRLHHAHMRHERVDADLRSCRAARKRNRSPLSRGGPPARFPNSELPFPY